MKLKSLLKQAKNSKFTKDLFITVIGQIVVLLVTFGLNKVLSNKVSIADFGVYNTIKKASAVLTYIMLIAMGIAIPKYLPERFAYDDKKGASAYFFSALIIIGSVSVVTIAVMMFAQVPIAKLIFGAEGYNKYIAPMTVYSFAVALVTFAYSYYRAVERFYAYSISQIIGQFITFIPIFFLHNDLVMLVWVWAASFGVFALVILIKASIKMWKTAPICGIKELGKPTKELLTYGLPRLPGEFVLFALSLVPLIIISNKFDLIQTGYYSAALTVNTSVTALFSFVGIILLPAVSKSLVNNDFDAIKKRIVFITIVFCVLALLMIGFVELFPKFVINVLYSKEYYEAIPIIKIIIIGILPNAFYLLFRNPLDAISKIPYNTICLLIGFATMVGLMLAFDTIEMCAVAYVIGYTVIGVLSIIAWLLCLHLRKKKIEQADRTEAASDETNKIEEKTEED